MTPLAVLLLSFSLLLPVAEAGTTGALAAAPGVGAWIGDTSGGSAMLPLLPPAAVDAVDDDIDANKDDEANGGAAGGNEVAR